MVHPTHTHKEGQLATRLQREGSAEVALANSSYKRKRNAIQYLCVSSQFSLHLYILHFNGINFAYSYALPIYHQANEAPFLDFLLHIRKFTYKPLLN